MDPVTARARGRQDPTEDGGTRPVEAMRQDGVRSADRDADDFLASFDGLAQAIRRARGAAPQDRPGLLTFSQYALLTPLCDHHAAHVSDLAAQAGIAPSTATRILDALERRAIVRRDRSDRDRRQVTVTLTAEGRQTLGRQHAWMRGRQLAFFGQLPATERELVADLLLRLSTLIDELAGGPAE